MRDVDEDAADLFLEGAVLQERDTVSFPSSNSSTSGPFSETGVEILQDARLHVDLVKRYLGRLGELLEDSDAKSHLREQGQPYSSLTGTRNR